MAETKRKARTTKVLKSFAEFAGDRQFSTTLGRSFEILRCFAPEKPLLGNKELADRTGLPKPTVSRLTYTLCQLGYLRNDRASSKFRLGPGILAISYPLLASVTMRQIARPAMKALADYAGGSVSMGVRDRLNIVYLETSRSNSSMANQLSDIGLSHPIAATAIGRAYLAACAPAEREAIINQIRVYTPDIWRQHQVKVRQSLEAYERYGFCMSFGDLRREVYAVAVPMRLFESDEIIVFNCVLQSVVISQAQMRADIGPRLAAMVRGLGGRA